MPTPVVAESQEQRRFLHDQQWAKVIAQLAAGARLSLYGIGHIGWNAPLHVDGFIADEELAELIELGAIGEIGGWAFDRQGRLIVGRTNERVTALQIRDP